MDWSDILTKIGVGLCLGFGIITLAKLAKKNPGQNSQPHPPEQENDPPEAPDDKA